MPNGEIGDERITERRKYLPNNVIKMNKKIQEVTNIIEGKKTNGQVAQAVQAGYVMNPEIERYRVANPPPHCDINQWYKHTNVQRMWQTYYLE